MFEPRSVGFILNPRAGRKKVEMWEREIRRALQGGNVKWELVRTSAPREAMKIAAELAPRMDLVVAVGGDGTVHEVAQGVINTNAVLGLIPNGSGNDYNRYLRMPRDIQTCTRALLAGCVTSSADVVKLLYSNEDSPGRFDRWMINTVGFGYDAAVAFSRDKIPLLKGFPLYLTSALLTLAKYRSHRFRVSVGSLPEVELAGLMVCAGVGEFEGGGFKVLPGANHEDGTMAICSVRSVNKPAALLLLTRAVGGWHIGSDNVRMQKGSTMRVESVDPFAIHADGEVLTDRATYAEASIVSGGLKVARYSSVV